jgi:uncharacterized protein (TIGR03083 family)
MTSPERDPLVELRYALAEAEACEPATEMLDGALTEAFAERPPGRLVDEAAAIAPIEVFARAVRAFEALLAELGADDWAAPALRDLDVQGLVGHLIGVEHDFREALAAAGGARPSGAGHVESTQPHALAQSGRSPASTAEDWRAAAAVSLELLRRPPLPERVALHGVELGLEEMLVVRAFELWTHEEDIRRATVRQLRPPDPPSLQRMVDLAIVLLPFVLPARGTTASVRLVLIGDAGGTFDVAFSSPVATLGEGPRAHVVADSVDFCRLIANRATGVEVALSLTGDRELAETLLAGAATLALD